MNTRFWHGLLKEREWLKVMPKLKNVTTLHCSYGWWRSLHMTAQRRRKALEKGCSPNVYCEWPRSNIIRNVTLKFIKWRLFWLSILKTVLTPHLHTVSLRSILILSPYLGSCLFMWSLSFMISDPHFLWFCISIPATYPAHLVSFI